MASTTKIPPVADRRLNVSSMDLGASDALFYIVWSNISTQSQRSLFAELFGRWAEANVDSVIADIETFRGDVLRVRKDVSPDEFTWEAAFLLAQLSKPPYSNELLQEAIQMAADNHPAALSKETFRQSVTLTSPGYIGGYDSIVEAVVKQTGKVSSK